MPSTQDCEYTEQIISLTSNALLHLLITVSGSKRHVPVHKRNEILVRHLKSKLNDKRLKKVKSDTRLFLQIGRTPEANLEKRLFIILNGAYSELGQK